MRTPEVKERVEGKAEEKKEDGKEDKTSTPSPVAAQDEVSDLNFAVCV